MVTFSIALVLLIIGYLTYGKFIDTLLEPDSTRKTPAVTMTDGVDYVPLPTWKIFMIQFLNIAGLGPIYGAIMGSQFGTASYLWIVFGTIFAGAVHDFFSGSLSLRNGGESLPELTARYLGVTTKKATSIFTVLLMVLIGAVFVSGPAQILDKMTPAYFNEMFWLIVIFGYYILATMLPVDKIIGGVYPVFALALLFMAIGLGIMLYFKAPDLPEMWDGFGTKYEKNPIFPMMFISIACGAISGFHGTQSPLMARCITNEKHCRPIFYGAMVTEGIVALIWAASATQFFHENGVIDPATGKAFTPATVATALSNNWLGSLGGILAILGIVAAPITSGDTALRSARLIIADFFHIEQRKIGKRLMISIPIFVVTLGLLIFSISNPNGFGIIWRYFSWCNQTLATITLWAITVYLVKAKKLYWVALIPALFMTCVCSTYIMIAPEGLQLSGTISYPIGIVCTIIAAVWFAKWYKKNAVK